jgi:hypothetical protein
LQLLNPITNLKKRAFPFHCCTACTCALC